MPKPRRKPSPPPQGDTGPDTPAQRNGADVITYREKNGAEYRRKRRKHALEIMHGAGKINARQCAAGIKLHELHCIVEMTGDAPFTKCYVDTSPNPSAVSLVQAERLSGFVDLFRHVPSAFKSVVWHVAIHGKQLRAGFSRDGRAAQAHKAQLQVALDLLANRLNI